MSRNIIEYLADANRVEIKNIIPLQANNEYNKDSTAIYIHKLEKQLQLQQEIISRQRKEIEKYKKVIRVFMEQEI